MFFINLEKMTNDTKNKFTVHFNIDTSWWLNIIQNYNLSHKSLCVGENVEVLLMAKLIKNDYWNYIKILYEEDILHEKSKVYQAKHQLQSKVFHFSACYSLIFKNIIKHIRYINRTDT